MPTTPSFPNPIAASSFFDAVTVGRINRRVHYHARYMPVMGSTMFRCQHEVTSYKTTA